MFQANQKIGGYTLIRKLGTGGFGEVWLAEKRSEFITRQVAIKLPTDEQVDKEAIRREAQLWEQASGHPNVLPIIDADIYDGQVAIVSEYADGGSLHDKLRREGKLNVKDAVEIISGVLRGLEYLHARRIVHRDIKPANILLQNDTPRLADFGISRAMQTAVISSAIIGTNAYMSPEAFNGERTPQTDIWSVGVVLYQLLTNRLPFPRENPSERMFSILTRDFEPLSEDIPPHLRNVIARALAKQPASRYQSAQEMRAALQSGAAETLPSEETRLRPTPVDSSPLDLTALTPTPLVMPSKTKPVIIPLRDHEAKPEIKDAKIIDTDKAQINSSKLDRPKKRLFLALGLLWLIALISWSGYGLLLFIESLSRGHFRSDAIEVPLFTLLLWILTFLPTFPGRWLYNWIRFGKRDPTAEIDTPRKRLFRILFIICFIFISMYSVMAIYISSHQPSTDEFDFTEEPDLG